MRGRQYSGPASLDRVAHASVKSRRVMARPLQRDLMVVGEVGGRSTTGNPQRRHHGSFAGHQQRAHQQDQDMLPYRGRQEAAEGLNPHQEHIGSVVASGGRDVSRCICLAESVSQVSSEVRI